MALSFSMTSLRDKQSHLDACIFTCIIIFRRVLRREPIDTQRVASLFFSFLFYFYGVFLFAFVGNI